MHGMACTVLRPSPMGNAHAVLLLLPRPPCAGPKTTPAGVLRVGREGGEPELYRCSCARLRAKTSPALAPEALRSSPSPSLRTALRTERQPSALAGAAYHRSATRDARSGATPPKPCRAGGR